MIGLPTEEKVPFPFREKKEQKWVGLKWKGPAWVNKPRRLVRGAKGP